MSDCSKNAFKVPEKPKLKSCPFCHGQIKLTHGEYITSPIAMFKCDNCGAVISFDDPVCNTGALNNDDTPAIRAFNTRYEPICHWKAEKDGEWRLQLLGECGYSINIDRDVLEEEKFCARCGGRIEVVD